MGKVTKAGKEAFKNKIHVYGSIANKKGAIQWHLSHKMPKNPTQDQRVVWHVEHAKNCQCRPLGGKILEEIKKRGLIESAPLNSQPE